MPRSKRRAAPSANSAKRGPEVARTGQAATPAPSQRIDKWLCHARLFKTRSAAATHVETQSVRINGQRVTRAAATVSPNDVLTYAVGGQVRVIAVRDIAQRRGPFREAQSLYEDRSPGVESQSGHGAGPAAQAQAAANSPVEPGAGLGEPASTD